MKPSEQQRRNGGVAAHPSDAELVEAVIGRLELDHLRSCPTCVERAEGLAARLEAPLPPGLDDRLYRRQAEAIERRIDAWENRSGRRRAWLRSSLAAAALAAVVGVGSWIGLGNGTEPVPVTTEAPELTVPTGDAADDALLREIDAVLAADPYEDSFTLSVWLAESESAAATPVANG